MRHIKTDYREADLDGKTRALLDYAAKLTATPSEVTLEDVDLLRKKGWSDSAVHDAAQVIGYFNYINRIADGLGVDPEPDLP